MLKDQRIHKGYGVELDKRGNRHHLVRVTFMSRPVLASWEEVATFIVVLTDFTQNGLERDTTYEVGPIKIRRAEKDGVHYLRLTVEYDGRDSSIYLTKTEVKIFPAILNRVIARCDVLEGLDGSSSFEDTLYIVRDGVGADDV